MMKHFSNTNLKRSDDIEKTNAQDIDAESKLQKYWKIAFWGIALIVFIVLLVLAPKVGVTGDEPLDGLNGKYALKYYTEGDTTFADYSKDENLKDYAQMSFVMRYYGTGYEIWTAIFLKYFHLSPANEFTFRHVLCALFGFLLFLFTALTVKRLANWRAATLALVLIAATPVVFGLSFFATKDIPFAAGFAIANYAIISIFQHLPKFKISDILLAIAGVAMAISVRIGGFLLTIYIVIAFVLYILLDSEIRKTFFTKPYTLLWKSLAIGTGIVAIGCLVGLSFYPNFFYEGPVEHIKNATTLVSKFPQRIPMLFEGKMIDSLNLPDHYLLKSFLYTIPLFIFASLFLFLLNIVNIWKKKYDRAALLYVLITLAIPLIVIFKSQSNVYNGWRHETFIYSNVIILASIGLYETWMWCKKRFNNKICKWAFPLIIIIVISPTLTWMAKNHKYCYSYYNALVKDPYLSFDLDYFETSQTICLDWLLKNELKDNNKKVVISSKNINAVQYFKNKNIPNDSIYLSGLKAFASSQCDYSIISTHFLEGKYIKDFFPPKGTIHVEYINGKPIAAVVKRNKLDSKGIALIQKGKYQEGLQLLDSAYKYDPNNFGIWFWVGFGAYQNKQYEKAVKFLDKDLNFHQDNNTYPLGLMYKGAALAQLEKYDEAIPVLKNAEKRAKDENLPFIKAQIGLAYYHKDNYRDAVPYLEACIPNYPSLSGLLQQCKDLSKTQPASKTTADNATDTTSKQKTLDLFKL